VIDDEDSLLRTLHTSLSALGFAIQEARTGEHGIELLRRRPFDAVLLDINMSSMSGISTCRQMRRMSAVLAILIMTVQDSPEDVVRALDAGADDYLKKPFHLGELGARLRAALRRVRPASRSAELLCFGELELDVTRRTFMKSGRHIHLTPIEFELLRHLMANAGVPMAHRRLLQAVWGPEYGGELEYLRTFVRQLREKIEEEPSCPSYLITVPCVGYLFTNGRSNCTHGRAEVVSR
jgi:two-component system KDP operon response regulator KdpE